jgi:hypothetical protein
MASAALAPPGLLGRYAAVHQMAWGISETIAPLLMGLLLVRGNLRNVDHAGRGGRSHRRR